MRSASCSGGWLLAHEERRDDRPEGAGQLLDRRALLLGRRLCPGLGGRAGSPARRETFLGTTNGDLFPAWRSPPPRSRPSSLPIRVLRVSLAIVWGTTLERHKVRRLPHLCGGLSALIYPIISHWIFGGGWLQASFGMRTSRLDRRAPHRGPGALAALLRSAHATASTTATASRTSFRSKHDRWWGSRCGAVVRMVRFQRGIHIGSDRTALRRRRRGHQPRGRRGRDGALAGSYLRVKALRHRHGRQRGRLPRSWPSPRLGLRRVLGAPIIGFVAGGLVVICIIPSTGSWTTGGCPRRTAWLAYGTLACGRSPSPRLAELNAIGEGGLFYTGLVRADRRAGAGHRRLLRDGTSPELPRVLCHQVPTAYG